ncbi:MAG: site-specific integrase [Symploca sp. SIO3E6]|nr:site-specific integrase [Caldora sp. SIO3E6]
MARNKKGTVAVEAVKGRLRLRLPRFSICTKRYLSLGLDDTLENRKIAILKAAEIEKDLLYENFDPSLRKYKSPQQQREKTLLVDIWNAYVEAKKPEVSLTTLNTDFRRVYRKITSFPVAAFEARKFQNWLTKKYSQEVSRRTLVQLKAACGWAVKQGLLMENPLMNTPKKKVKKSFPEPFTEAERDAIIKAFENSPHYSFYTPFVKFQFFTGARPSETVALRWRHIDEELTFITFSEALVDGQLKDTKTHQPRIFPVNQAIKELLTSLRPVPYSPDLLVFPSKTGKSIDEHNFSNRAWKTVLGGLKNIKHRAFYKTRHTFITSCLEKGVPVALVAKWVGNSPQVIWSSYAGIISEVPVPEP